MELPITRKLQTNKSVEQAVVVLGEASESEEEEIVTSSYPLPNNVRNTPSVPVNIQRQAQLPVIKTSLPQQSLKYNSLLHTKLRERNEILRQRVLQAVHQPYQMVAKELNSISQHMVKSQSHIQEVGPILRILTNDLFQLEDKLDITLDCSKLIPAINVQPNSPETVHSAFFPSVSQASNSTV